MREEVTTFAAAMHAALEHNAHKDGTGWSTTANTYLLHKMSRAQEDLEIAINSFDPDMVRRAAVNAANYAMMLFDNYYQR